MAAAHQPSGDDLNDRSMKLLIVIPALNEEESIREITQRSLDARDSICAGTDVTEVEVTVVSDGSTDRTVEYAQQFGDRIKLIVFPENRGYGAAVLEAWRQSEADLLSFLDADGTCDPRFFSTLVSALKDDNADIALGCRITETSEMPRLRRVGNKAFALLLSAISTQKVRDTASGMRVIRRASLKKVLPLPAGLNFTPAMSARAVLADDLKIVEREMDYKERQGESKLSPGRDGIRFLAVILKTALIYRPSRVLGMVGVLCILVAAVLMTYPIIYYLRFGELQEWMIYRFVVSELLGVTAVMLMCAGYIGTRISSMLLGRRQGIGVMSEYFRSRSAMWVPPLLILLGGALVVGSFVDYVTTGKVIDHWSRFIVASFFFLSAAMLGVTKFLDYVLDLVIERQDYLGS